MVAKRIRSLDALARLQNLIVDFESDGALSAPDRFRERAEALERLDAFDLDSDFSIPSSSDSEVALYRRARALRCKLEDINSQLYESIRDAIRRGAGRDAVLRWRLRTGREEQRQRDDGRHGDGDGFDHLDELVSGVLRFGTPGKSQIELTAEMVAYQPTPARHIFDLIRQVKLTAQDIFIDLGSGLGHVPLLVAICTQARALGIELEPSYVECARRCASDLKLPNATFLVEDAREADLSNGTIFYLYTPFRGAILRAVLDRVRAQAAMRKIRICTFGPCSAMVAAESWIALDSDESSHISVFRSRNS